MKIKKGDTVIVTVGKDKGKTGKVLDVFKEEMKVIVEGVNMLTNHIRPTRDGEKGRKVVKASPILASKVALTDASGKARRVGYKMVDGKKTRFLKGTEETL